MVYVVYVFRLRVLYFIRGKKKYGKVITQTKSSIVNGERYTKTEKQMNL